MRLTLAKLNEMMRYPARYLSRVHPMLARPRGFYVQSEMDISPRSIWHIHEFVAAIGGFFIPEDCVERRIYRIDAWDLVRRDMLILQMRSVLARHIEGDFAELGVFQGDSARLIHQYAPDRKLHLFDTFNGFDPRDLDVELPVGTFANTSVEAVIQKIEPRNDNVVVHAGRFPDTAPEAFGKFAFVHIDVDLFEPTTAGLEFFYPHMSRGGIIVVHDYNSCDGARHAVDQFFASRPEVPIAMPDRCGSALIVKS